MFTRRGWQLWVTISIVASTFPPVLSAPWTPVVVKKVTQLGPQLSPGVTNVSRDGGYSSLINGRIIWTYDDTECFDNDGEQLSFISNTAAYSDRPDKDVSKVVDFGVIEVGKDGDGKPKKAILADKTVGTGGWIPFQADELDFNEKNKGKERVAIWPGTSPTSINPAQALLFAPLVYVDSKPKDLAKQYADRGMTLITITAPKSGPVATRQGDLIIPGQEVPFGGFSTLIGFTSTEQDADAEDRDIYMLGMADNGLQLARVGINDIRDWGKYVFYDPEKQKFSNKAPKRDASDPKTIYLPGTFSSGSVFYSPHFQTFVMVYFNKMADSTFYVRYLDLDKPHKADSTWSAGGRNGEGIVPEDAEALVNYAWSVEQKIWTSPTKQGGFNYAGMAHPEFFNRQYFAPTLYPVLTPKAKRVNDWYGSNLVAEADAGGDGKYMLLSWTAQLQSGTDKGIYQVQLALLEFGAIPPNPATTATAGLATDAVPTSTALGSASSVYSRPGWKWHSGVFGLTVLLHLGMGALRL